MGRIYRTISVNSSRWATLTIIGFMLTLTACNLLPGRPATAPLVVIPHGMVVVYAKTACPYCRQAKEYLTRQRVTFVTRDVEHDAAAREELLALYRERLPEDRVIVPLIVTDSQIISGYIEEELAAFVAKHKAAVNPD